MKHLVTLRDGFEAKVLAARLGSEGVLVELRGSVDGMYPVGQIHLYVEESGLETAREVLALAETHNHASHDGEDGWDPDDEPEHRSSARDRRKLLAVLAVGLVAVLVMLEVIRHVDAPARSQPLERPSAPSEPALASA
jgi:hypothetical protein